MHDQTYGRIEITPLEEGCWRLCDGSLDENDPRRLVAYVEQGEKGVAVLWLRRAHRETHFSSFDAAVQAADALLSAEERERDRSRRPVFIPHFPPPPRGAARRFAPRRNA